MARLEIAVTSLKDALRAEQGGADSIEVSVNLAAGGLTPSVELLTSIVKIARLDVHVIVRPHPDSFHYSPSDIVGILKDAERFARLDVKSIVFGAHDSQGRLDIDLIGRVQTAASPKPVTIHRAIDSCHNPEDALQALAKMGIKRILTAGPASNAWDGRLSLALWISNHPQFSFVMSGGLKLEQLPELAPLVKAQEYHFGSAARSNECVDPAKVQCLRMALNAASASG